jgi:DNA/RNA endonuclease YhcR with UshA esterase domain
MSTRTIAWITATAAAVLAAALPALAHHSAVAEYDLDKPVKVSGVVTKVEWTNPHIWFYVDVKNDDGSVTNWGFSGAPPGVLQRRGIFKTTMKPGDVVRVDGFRAKDGSANASGNNVTFADGRQVFTAMEGFPRVAPQLKER